MFRHRLEHHHRIEGVLFMSAVRWVVAPLSVIILLVACELPSDSVAHELPAMVNISAGVFIRGCNPSVIAMVGAKCEDDPESYPALNTPAREIYLSEYWIDRFEVTISEYEACLDAGACQGSYAAPPLLGVTADELGRLPVGGLSWFEAAEFCEWQGKRLPTEAEWEKAARGSDDERVLPWGNTVPECGLVNSLIFAVDCPDAPRRPVAVDQFPGDVSPYGVRGMAGNLREWVSDWRDLDYYETSPSTDPSGPTEMPNVTIPRRVLRGGYYDAPIPGWNLPIRRGAPPDEKTGQIGFRCAQ